MTLVGLGVLLVLVATSVAVALGPDDQVRTGPHAIEVSDRAIATAPGVLAYAGPQVSVVADLGDERPVFIGLAHPVDVDDYLGGTAHEEVATFALPWEVSTDDVDGDPYLPAAPTALDWWWADAAGVGKAELRFDLPSDSASLAVLALGDGDLEGLRISAAYEWPGGFGIAVGSAAAGIGLVGIGLALLRVRPFVRRRRADPAALADDEWEVPWPETDPADTDTLDDFLEEVR
ncbi:UNVERIFIED_CONTAM: hypothetical protein LK11_01305 [Mumia flava]